MTHDAWIFLDILVIVFGLLIAMSMYTGMFENSNKNESNNYPVGDQDDYQIK